nr:hypothetical protein [Pea streak virus]
MLRSTLTKSVPWPGLTRMVVMRVLMPLLLEECSVVEPKRLGVIMRAECVCGC